ncbi:pro-Pol polyprotein [Trichonephila clavipes]|nr:pro-Pol polyprotein [Trichonephila clavipes]
MEFVPKMINTLKGKHIFLITRFRMRFQYNKTEGWFRDASANQHQIEFCLNSRPLTELSPDPSDFNALTPAHFLMGVLFISFQNHLSPQGSVGLSERWNLIQRLPHYFWYRWSTEYFTDLQPRSKWWRTKPNLQLEI